MSGNMSDIKIQDLPGLSTDELNKLRDKICASLRRTSLANKSRTMSNCSSVVELSAQDSLGIELQDDDSVIYIPASEEENVQDGDDENYSDITLTFSESSIGSIGVFDETTVIDLTKSRKRSATKQSNLNTDTKRARTSFASILSTPKDAKRDKVNKAIDKALACSTPKVTEDVMCKHNELNDVSPICKDVNVQIAPEKNKDGGECACACTCREMQQMVEDVRQLLAADGPLGNLKKIMNLGEAFEQYRQECAQFQNRQVVPVMTAVDNDGAPDNQLETLESVKTYHDGETFVTDNIHYENGEDAENRTGLRPIVIDGSNIAMAHGHDNWFSTRGLRICIEFFARRGHRVFAFVPAHRLRADGCDDARGLRELVRQGLVFVTSSWDAGGRRYCAYDDRIMLQVAAAMGAVVVSRDHFRDLKKEDARFERVLQKGLLMPTFVGDMLIFPQDPLGRRGPTLDRFLQFP